MTQANGEFDVSFNLETDQPSRKHPDADRDSPVLRRYHQMLWSKKLRSGQEFTLEAPSARRHGYLIHTDSAGNHFGAAGQGREALHRLSADLLELDVNGLEFGNR